MSIHVYTNMIQKCHHEVGILWRLIFSFTSYTLFYIYLLLLKSHDIIHHCFTLFYLPLVYQLRMTIPLLYFIIDSWMGMCSDGYFVSWRITKYIVLSSYVNPWGRCYMDVLDEMEWNCSIDKLTELSI